MVGPLDLIYMIYLISMPAYLCDKMMHIITFRELTEDRGGDVLMVSWKFYILSCLILC